MNEAGNIRPLIDEICGALSGRNFEIIYIDDASNDDSPAELADAQAAVSQLRVLRHHRQAGQSAAIRSGLLRRVVILLRCWMVMGRMYRRSAQS